MNESLRVFLVEIVYKALLLVVTDLFVNEYNICNKEKINSVTIFL